MTGPDLAQVGNHRAAAVDRDGTARAEDTARRRVDWAWHLDPEHNALTGGLKGKEVVVLGLSFKPETDDMREAPSVDIIRALVEKGAKVRAYDPVAAEQARKTLPRIVYAEDEYAAAEGADCLVFMTEWNQFRALDMGRVRGLMREPRVADLRNIYDPERMRELGFEYVGVGR